MESKLWNFAKSPIKSLSNCRMLLRRHKSKFGTMALLFFAACTFTWAKSMRHSENGTVNPMALAPVPKAGPIQRRMASSKSGEAQKKVEKAEGEEEENGTLGLRKKLETSLDRFLVGIPTKDEDWCRRMASGQLEPIERAQLAQWTFNESKFLIRPPPDEDEMNTKVALLEQNSKCAQLNRLLPFAQEPLSEEERQFPLAYGLLVHKSPLQVLALLSAIYQPQNAYCLVVDEKADEQFKKEMQLLADCFPNIFLMSVGKIFWCKFGIVRAVFGCLKYFSGLDHDWRYFQYLSGVDVPLKTNLEMVRILKRLNGTVNADVLPFEEYRVRLTSQSMKSPLTLWKSSLSALIPRQAANAMVRSEKVRELFNFLQYTWCSDESLWATIAGNPGELAIPGGFNASALFSQLLNEANHTCLTKEGGPGRSQSAEGDESEEGEGEGEEGDREEEPFRLSSSYISRYQLWNEKKRWRPLARSPTKCHGKYASESCVFGMADVPSLLRRPELVAHKMYLDFQPAAYFCLWKTVWERALDRRAQQKFQGRVYSQLPAVRMARGESGEGIRHFFDKKCHLSISG